ncbi:MAG: outer membrane protein transport protein [bacterium]
MKKYDVVFSIIFILTLTLYSSVQASTTIYQQTNIASSPNPVGSGARAVGMGGAFIAIADDATAASWNPAGLIQLERLEVSLVGISLERREELSFTTHSEGNSVGEIDDSNINYFSATFPFQFYQNFVVSLNYQRLYEFKRNLQYRITSLEAEQIKDVHYNQKGYLGTLGLGVACEISPGISLGSTINIWRDDLFWDNGWEETYSCYETGTQNGIPLTYNTCINDQYSDFHGVNLNLGLLWNISKSFTLGAVVKTPFEASAHHEFRFTQSINSNAPEQANMSEGIELHMPLSYGIGAAWRVSDALSFDFDIYRTHWRDYVLVDSQGNELNPIDGRFKSNSNVDNTTQVHLGGEYLFINKETDVVIPARAGIFYDPEPSRNGTDDFYGLALGSGIAYKKYIFDLAYQLRWSNNINSGEVVADNKEHRLLGSVIVHF